MYDEPNVGINLFVFNSNLSIEYNDQPKPIAWNSPSLFSNLLTELL